MSVEFVWAGLAPPRQTTMGMGFFSDPTLVGCFVLLEPAGYVKHFCDVMAGAAADPVRFLGYADEDGVDVEELEGRVELFGFGDGSAIVSFAGHQQSWRFDFGDEIGQRALHVL